MKKGVFNIWLKELCSLVFVQSVQAFLLAIIMSIILSAQMTGTDSASVSPVGVISIIALASISKIELLIKKIFGIESQFGDPSMANGMKSVAGGIIAAKAAGKVLNNVPKIAGGLKESVGAKRDISKANYNMARRLNLLNQDSNGQDKGESANATPQDNINVTQSGVNNNLNNGPELSEEGQQWQDWINDHMDDGPNSKPSASVINGSSGSSSRPSASVVNVNSGANTSTTSGNATSKARLNNTNYQSKLLDIQEKYDKELSEAKKRRAAGRKKMVSGVSETIGAIGGASVGLAVGLGTGNVSHSIAYGMGAGDVIGKDIVEAGDFAKSSVTEHKAAEKQKIKTLNEMQKLVSENSVEETRKASNLREKRAIRKSTRSAAEQIEKQYGVKIDASKL